MLETTECGLILQLETWRQSTAVVVMSVRHYEKELDISSHISIRIPT
jgi:hypothetical protein